MVAAKYLLALLPALASAHKLPAGLEDGVYTVTVDDSGNEIHERVDIPATSSARSFKPRNLQKRFDVGGSWCGCDNPVSQPDCDAATGMLKGQVGSGVSIELQSYYSVSNSVVAFVCANWDGFAIDVDDLTEYFSAVTEACGEYISGTVMGAEDFITAEVGYMAYTPGGDFCGASESSGAHSC